MSVVFFKKSIATFGIVAAVSLAPAMASAACFEAPAKLSDAEISQFLASPEALLDANPVGGLPLSNRVRSLVGSSDAALDAIVQLASNATAAQNAAFGSALGSVANACADVEPEYAQKIQDAVAALGNQDMITAFRNASNDPQVAALGRRGRGAGARRGGGSTDQGSHEGGPNNRQYAGNVHHSQSGGVSGSSGGHYVSSETN